MLNVPTQNIFQLLFQLQTVHFTHTINATSTTRMQVAGLVEFVNQISEHPTGFNVSIKGVELTFNHQLASIYASGEKATGELTSKREMVGINLSNANDYANALATVIVEYLTAHCRVTTGELYRVATLIDLALTHDTEFLFGTAAHNSVILRTMVPIHEWATYSEEFRQQFTTYDHIQPGYVVVVNDYQPL